MWFAGLRINGRRHHHPRHRPEASSRRPRTRHGEVYQDGAWLDLVGRYRASGQIEVRIAGDLNADTVPYAECWLARLGHGDQLRVTAAIEGLRSLDFAGVAVLVNLRKSLLERGGELILCSCSKRIRAILELAGEGLLRIVRRGADSDTPSSVESTSSEGSA